MDIRQKFLYVVVGLIPFLAISPWQKFFTIPVGVIYAFLTGLLVLAYRSEFFRSLWDFRGKAYSVYPVLAYLGVVLISSMQVWSTSGLLKEHYIRMAYLVFAIVVFWLYSIIPTDKSEVEGILKAYLIGAALAGMYGMFITVGYMFGLPTGQVAEWTVPRLYGTATEAQVFGNFLLSAFPILLAGYLLSGRRLFGTASLPVLWLLFTVLLMTFSAGAWAGAVVGCLPLILQIRKFRLRQVFSVLLVFVLSLTFFVAVDRFVYPGYLRGFDSITMKITGTSKSANLTQNDVNINMVSVEHRQWFREAAMSMFKEHPLMGVGFGNYGYLYNQYRPQGTPALDIYVRAHNQYLEILAELGIVGLTSLLIVVAQVMWLIYRVIRFGQDSYTISLAIALFAALTALGAHGYFLGIFLHNYFWVVLGLTFAACRLALAEERLGR